MSVTLARPQESSSDVFDFFFLKYNKERKG